MRRVIEDERWVSISLSINLPTNEFVPMEMAPMIVLIICVAAVVLVSLAVHLRNERRRTANFREMAESLGMAYRDDLRAGLRDKIGSLRLMNRGHSRKVRNVMLAETEAAVMTIFDYQYTTGGGNNSNTQRLTVVAMESDALTGPAFELWPEGWWSRVGSKFGMQDIDFESNPEFSQSYVLRGEDEPAVREFFSERRLQFFADRPGRKVEQANGVLIVFDSRKSADEVSALMQDAVEMLEVLKQPAGSLDLG